MQSDEFIARGTGLYVQFQDQRRTFLAGCCQRIIS